MIKFSRKNRAKEKLSRKLSRKLSLDGDRQGAIVYKDIALNTLTWLTALFIAGIFCWIVFDIFGRGVGQLSWDFLTTAPRDSGRVGGIAPILVSTVLLVGVCLSVALPLGLGTAVLLAEFTPTDSQFGRLVRVSLDILTGVPSIVFGLFGNAFFSITLGLGFSLLSGGLTLSCMVLPIFIRSVEKGLRSVPEDYRLGAASLGLSRTTTLLNLLLPAAIPSVMAGLILGIGRAMAETAALIYTSGSVYRMPQSLFDSGRSLSLHIYELSTNVPGGDSHAYASALVLLFLLLAIDAIAIWIADKLLHQRIQG